MVFSSYIENRHYLGTKKFNIQKFSDEISKQILDISMKTGCFFQNFFEEILLEQNLVKEKGRKFFATNFPLHGQGHHAIFDIA